MPGEQDALKIQSVLHCTAKQRRGRTTRMHLLLDSYDAEATVQQLAELSLGNCTVSVPPWCNTRVQSRSLLRHRVLVRSMNRLARMLWDRPALQPCETTRGLSRCFYSAERCVACRSRLVLQNPRGMSVPTIAELLDTLRMRLATGIDPLLGDSVPGQDRQSGI